jgi:outer membrane protein assembly factor BamA
VLLSVNTYAQEPPDTTKEREPYPEPRSIGSDILAVPQFIIDIPFNLIEGAAGFLIEDLYGGLLAAHVTALIANVHRIWGFYPVFSTGNRSGIEYGLGFRSKGVFTREERLKIKGSYSANDYQNIKIQYRAPNFIDPDLGVTFLGQYRQRPWESFYGLGNNSPEKSQVNYNPEHSHLRAGALWTINDNWKTELVLGYDAYNIFDGEDPNLEGNIVDIIPKLQLSPGEVRGSRLISFGGTIDHDWRNNNGQPTSGGRELVSLVYYESTRDFDDFAFWRTSVDIRHYLELFKKRTLALRILVESVDPSGTSPALPFYLKNSLGGVDNFRGYRNGRFLDNDLATASVEYRYPILEMIDGFVFLDEGRVFNNLSDDFKWHDWKYSYGAGLRIFNDEDIMLRTFIAKSKEDSRFYLEFSDAF